MNAYILDTHSLVWFLEGNKRLSSIAKEILFHESSYLVIPTIVLVEISFLYSKRRINIDFQKVKEEIISRENCTIYPLDEEVVLRIPTVLNIHDAIITATALVYQDVLGQDVAIITRDESIKNSGI